MKLLLICAVMPLLAAAYIVSDSHDRPVKKTEAEELDNIKKLLGWGFQNYPDAKRDASIDKQSANTVSQAVELQKRRNRRDIDLGALASGGMGIMGTITEMIKGEQEPLHGVVEIVKSAVPVMEAVSSALLGEAKDAAEEEEEEEAEEEEEEPLTESTTKPQKPSASKPQKSSTTPQP